MKRLFKYLLYPHLRPKEPAHWYPRDDAQLAHLLGIIAENERRNAAEVAPGAHTIYPNTYLARWKPQEEDYRAQVFDPALAHFSCGYRLADPRFADPTHHQEWLVARRRVIGHLLHLLAGSPWAAHLVLRGSLLMAAWYENAREPRDIDWVVRPQTLAKREPQATAMLSDIIRMVGDAPTVGNVLIDTPHIRMDDIWTYDRVEGTRLLFPWLAGGVPCGEVQMDFVFGETIPAPTMTVRVPTPDGPSTPVIAVTKEVALAWKMLWLATDRHPQGKDVYDATLLAEDVPWVREYSEHEWPYPQHPLDRSGLFVQSLLTDWDNFLSEYPWIAGTANDWQERLYQAVTRE